MGSPRIGPSRNEAARNKGASNEGAGNDGPSNPSAMTLRDVVAKYRELAGGFGRPVPLSSFGLTREQTERLFSVFDEDYHISRFFHLTLDPALKLGAEETYQISGFPQSHLSIDAAVNTIL